MASLLLLLAGLHAHGLRNHQPARDEGCNIRANMMQPAPNEQQNPAQAAANALYLHTQRWWTTLATHTMRRERTYQVHDIAEALHAVLAVGSAIGQCEERVPRLSARVMFFFFFDV